MHHRHSTQAVIVFRPFRNINTYSYTSIAVNTDFKTVCLSGDFSQEKKYITVRLTVTVTVTTNLYTAFKTARPPDPFYFLCVSGGRLAK